MICWFRLLSALVLTLVPVSAWAQAQPQVGIVTTLQGQATVSRLATPASLPLKFKDSIFERDKINTAEKSIVKVLMGGKAVVTVRELSVLTITEDVGRTTVNLESGKIAVAVARQLMKPGDRLEVRTPNAVAAVRGTIFVVEVTRQGAQLGGGSLGANTQVISVSGTVEVGSIGNPANTALLTAFQSVGVGSGALGRVGNVTPQAMNALLAGFAHSPQFGMHGDTSAAMAVQEQEKAEALAELLLPLTDNGSQQQNNTSGGCGGTPCVQTGTPIPPPPKGNGGNVVVNPGFETGSFPPGWNLSGAGAVIKNIGPITAPSGQFMGLIHTGTGAVGGTTSRLSQSGLDGSGSLFSVQVTYNFLSNEWPTQPLSFNDTFVAKVTDRGGVTTEVARAERDTAPFQATPTMISGGGFTLSKGNGIAGWKTSSKMVSTESGGLDKIAFEIFDVGDTIFDSAVLLDAVVVALDPPLHFLQGGATLTRTGLDPLIDFRGGTETFDSAMVIGAGSRVSLAGPLLRASGTDLNVGFSLFSVLPGGSFASSTTDPLVSLQGGTHALGSSIGIFDLAGSRTALDAETGLTLAIDRPLSTGGTLFQADGATVDTRQAVKVDTALLEATAPLIALLNGSTMTSAADAIDLTGRSKVTGAGSLVALDNSRLTVSRGALVNVAGGSYLRVAGDLVSLRNGSVLNILNGALLYVSGGSIVSVSGALVAFGGTGGSILSVSNSLCGGACVLIGGIPVAFSGGATAANVSTGAGAIKNPSLGTIKLASPSTALVSVSGPASKVTIGPK
ncbi:MAG: FecR family protein [Candidatus Rokubacteria bacterium]|nr:FecR family protein [Candidatus Rokubacteria bacterium]